jgi:hypothetical protein
VAGCSLPSLEQEVSPEMATDGWTMSPAVEATVRRKSNPLRT